MMKVEYQSNNFSRSLSVDVCVKSLITIVAMIAAYHLSTGLSVIDDLAAPIWLPAGAGLTAFVVWGRRVVMAILTGYFLISGDMGVGAGLINFSSEIKDILPFVLLGLIGFFHVISADWLLRRYANFPNLFLNASSILKFYLWGCFASSFISVILISVVLVFFELIPQGKFFHSFFNYWFAFANGTFLVVPPVLMFLAGRNPAYKTRALYAAIGQATGFALATLVIWQTYSSMQKEIRERRAEDTIHMVSDLQMGLLPSTQALSQLSIAAVYIGNFSVTTFNQLASAYLRAESASFAVAWAPLFDDEDRPQFEVGIRSDYGPDFYLKELDIKGAYKQAEPNARYIAPRYVYPVEGNSIGVGRELWNDPMNCKGLEAAMKASEPVMTRVLSYDNQQTIFLEHPVFTPEKNFLGFVIGGVYVAKFIDSALAEYCDKYNIQIRDLGLSRDDYLWQSVNLGSPKSRSNQSTTRQEQLLDISEDEVDTLVFKLASRTFEISVRLKETHFRQFSTWQVTSVVIFSGILAVLLGFVVLLITGQHLLTEQKVIKRTDDLQQALKIKSDFLANIGHEMRTPIGEIHALIDQAKEHLDAKDLAGKSSLDSAQQASQSLLATVNDILDYSLLEQKDVTLNLSFTHIETLIKTTVSKFEALAEKQDLYLTTKVCENLLDVCIDSERVSQILSNLISNSLKFTKNGRVSVAVDMQAVPTKTFSKGQSYQLKIIVYDTGIGISKSDQNLIFDDFSQVDPSAARRYAGTGLGLSIVKELINLMDGTLLVESSLGKGATFTVMIPISDENMKDVASNIEAIPINESKRVLTILLAEDNKINQTYLQSVLSAAGHEVQAFGNGLELLEYVKGLEDQSDIDVILMDVQMPEMDGLKTTEIIRKLSGPISQVPIIAVTANTRADYQRTYLASGMNAHISKPIDKMIMFREIDRVISRVG